jgi:hypothetical protein
VSSQRLAPLSGIVFVAALIIGIFVISSGSPQVTDSAQTIASYYVAHHQKSEFAVGVIAVGLVFFAIFVAYLYGHLKAAETSPSLWSTLMLIGGIAGIAAFFVAGAIHVALADGGTHHFGLDAMVALNGLDNDSLLAFVFALGLMLIGVAGATITTLALPKWLGWAALVLGVLCFTPVWWAGTALGLIWIVVVSIVLSQRVAATA